MGYIVDENVGYEESEFIGYIEERLGGECGRSYIERHSSEDAKYNINSRGRLAYDNAYGEIVAIYKKYGTTERLPVICGHGGSMWLCRKCKEGLLVNQIAGKDGDGI